MDLPPRTYPTFAPELLAARASLTLADEVGLAIRAHRRRLGLSRRRYADLRGWSASRVARPEARAGELELADVVDALDGTHHRLSLCWRPGSPVPDRREPA